MTSLTVVVVTKDRPQDLRESVEAIAKECPGSPVIVVESGEFDEARALMEQGLATAFYEPTLSMTAARNYALRLVQTDLVAFVDDDAIVQPGWRASVLEAFSDADTGALSGHVIPMDAMPSPPEGPVGKITSQGFVYGNYDALPPQQLIPIDCVIGCNMVFRTERLRAVGGFDERFLGNCFREDADASLRVKYAGSKVLFARDAKVLHKYRGKVLDNRWARWYMRNHTYFWLKHISRGRLLPSARCLWRSVRPPRVYAARAGIRLHVTPRFVAAAFRGLYEGVAAYRSRRAAGLH